MKYTKDMKEIFTPENPKTSRWSVKFALTLAACVAILLYLILRGWQLTDTAALYVGLPIILALTIAFTRPARSVTASALKAMTIFLLLSAPILQEGFICILMAAPVFYTITAVVGLIIDSRRKRKKRLDTLMDSPIAITLLVLLSLEGTHEYLSFERFNEITETKVVAADVQTVVDQLARSPSFDGDTPLLTRLFPKPVRAWGSGLSVGDSREVEFLYWKHVLFNPHRGSARFEVVESGDNQVRFLLTHDDSYISNYLRWSYSRVQWKALGPRETEVTWTLGYDRKLDPAWYFHPLQTYYVRLTARVLIDSLADPGAS